MRDATDARRERGTSAAEYAIVAAAVAGTLIVALSVLVHLIGARLDCLSGVLRGTSVSGTCGPDRSGAGSGSGEGLSTEGPATGSPDASTGPGGEPGTSGGSGDTSGGAGETSTSPTATPTITPTDTPTASPDPTGSPSPADPSP